MQLPSTHWSMIARAARAGVGQREALEEFLRRYLGPLRAYLIHGRRLGPDAADDLLQTFVCNKVLERHLVRRADRGRGRFRTFLLRALDRFVINWARDGRAQKRGADRVRPLEDGVDVPDAAPSPARQFELAWARQVLADAVERMRAECDRTRRGELYALFDARVLGPTLRQDEPEPFDALARRLGLRSTDEASNLLVTAKRMFKRGLRDAVGQYAATDAEAEAEVAELRAVLFGGGSR